MFSHFFLHISEYSRCLRNAGSMDVAQFRMSGSAASVDAFSNLLITSLCPLTIISHYSLSKSFPSLSFSFLYASCPLSVNDIGIEICFVQQVPVNIFVLCCIHFLSFYCGILHQPSYCWFVPIAPIELLLNLFRQQLKENEHPIFFSVSYFA